MDTSRFIGKGLGFPIIMEEGKPKMLEGLSLIRSSILSCLSHDKGYEYFRGNFGTRLIQLIERPLDDVTLTRARHYIQEVIETYETRVNINHIKFFVIESELWIEINLTVKIDNTTDSFIIPFINLIKQ